MWQEVTKNDSFPFLLPENFGAVGDGVTDDSRAFTECFATANANHKYILLSTKIYLITNTLTNISDTNLLGNNTTIRLGNNIFTKQAKNCYFFNIQFERSIASNLCLIENFFGSTFKCCYFVDIYMLFNDISPKLNMTNHLLLDECDLRNTQLITKNGTYNGRIYTINNTLFYYDENNNIHTFIINGYVGGKFIFNNCTISKFYPDNRIELFASVDELEFNNCDISQYDSANTFTLPNSSEVLSTRITFNNCNISNNNKTLVNVYNTNKTIFTNVYIKYSYLNINTIFNSQNECSLWLENNKINVKPNINSATGKVNIIEINQKNIDTDENIFPWDTETPTPTVENNVTLNSAGTGSYYVLTENEDKTIKKLDYYFKYTQVYTKGAPYYNTGQTFNGLDLAGYTVKTFMLKNNIFKLKDDNGDLIDYVYFDLNSADISGDTIPNGTHYTSINMQFIPAVTKWTGKEEANGKIDINTCITFILEKTS